MIVHHAPVKVYSLRVESSADFSNKNVSIHNCEPKSSDGKFWILPSIRQNSHILPFSRLYYGSIRFSHSCNSMVIMLRRKIKRYLESIHESLFTNHLDRIHDPENKGTSWPCLDDTPESSIIYGEPVCGNGLLEKGEDCDCGTTDPDQCNSKCCNAATCKFKDGANCDANDGPCCEDCHLKKLGSVCRESQSECDLPEYCDGVYARCKNNVYKRNGEPCSGSGRCMSGQCLTRDSHCKYIYGDASYHSSECMEEFNFDTGRGSGQYSGNCGQMKTWISRCSTKEDSFCGKTQCIDGDSRSVLQEFQHVAIGKHSSTNHECKFMDWREELKKLSRDSDYNFDQMPIGTPCGDESVCDADPSGIRRLCRPLMDLWIDSKWGTCPNNCTGRGWCNSNGNCHCFDGYGGEECNRPGNGGSSDSGHASASKMDEGTKMFILIFSCLFGLLIAGALVAKFKFKKNLTDIFLYQ